MEGDDHSPASFRGVVVNVADLLPARAISLIERQLVGAQLVFNFLLELLDDDLGLLIPHERLRQCQSPAATLRCRCLRCLRSCLRCLRSCRRRDFCSSTSNCPFNATRRGRSSQESISELGARLVELLLVDIEGFVFSLGIEQSLDHHLVPRQGSLQFFGPFEGDGWVVLGVDDEYRRTVWFHHVGVS